jgi:hypothetical protein
MPWPRHLAERIGFVWSELPSPWETPVLRRWSYGSDLGYGVESFWEMSTVVTAMRRRWEGYPRAAGGSILLRHPAGENHMKAAFGILALYVSIPLAIVAVQGVVAHEATLQQIVTHTTVAQAAPAPVVAGR